METHAADRVAIRRTVAVVALVNLGSFVAEAAVAAGIGSVALAADSIDFLEDASINLLVLLSLGTSPRRQATVATVLAGVIVLPSLATLWLAIGKIAKPVAPDPAALSLTAAAALLVNLGCALLLARVRRRGGSLTLAAFLSARNDALANLAMIAAGLLTALRPSPWPDLGVGLAIAVLNAGAAHAVFTSARGREHGRLDAPDP